MPALLASAHISLQLRAASAPLPSLDEGGAGVEEGLLRTISAPTTPHGDAAAEWASRLPQSTRALLGLIAAVLAGAIGGAAGRGEWRHARLAAADDPAPGKVAGRVACYCCCTPPGAGLTLAPMLAAPKHERGLPFVPSQSLGALIIAPIFTAALTCLPRPHGVSFTQASGARGVGHMCRNTLQPLQKPLLA